MLLALSHCVMHFRFLRHVNEICKICVFICLHKFDIIKLTSFSNKKLLEVTWLLVLLENIFHTVFLSILCVNVV